MLDRSSRLCRLLCRRQGRLGPVTAPSQQPLDAKYLQLHALPSATPRRWTRPDLHPRALLLPTQRRRRAKPRREARQCCARRSNRPQRSIIASQRADSADMFDAHARSYLIATTSSTEFAPGGCKHRDRRRHQEAFRDQTPSGSTHNFAICTAPTQNVNVYWRALGLSSSGEKKKNRAPLCRKTTGMCAVLQKLSFDPRQRSRK